MVIHNIAITLNLTNPLDPADIEHLNDVLTSVVVKFEIALDRTAVEPEDAQIVGWRIEV